MSHPAQNEPAIELGGAELDVEPTGKPEGFRRRIRRIFRTAVLAIMVVGVAFIGWTGWRVKAEKDAALTIPGSIGPLQLDRSDDGRSTAGYWQAKLSAEIGLNKTVGAVYLDGTGKNVTFFGGTKLLWAPGRVLNSAFGIFADNDSAVVTDLNSVDAGPLGGTMKCGGTETGSNDITVCGWADHGSVAVAMFVNRPQPGSATLLRQIRDATQTRL